MENVDVSAQVRSSFAQRELGNNGSALRRKVRIIYVCYRDRLRSMLFHYRRLINSEKKLSKVERSIVSLQYHVLSAAYHLATCCWGSASMTSRTRTSHTAIKREEFKSWPAIPNSILGPSNTISRCWGFTSLCYRFNRTYCLSACRTTTKLTSAVLLMSPVGVDFTTVSKRSFHDSSRDRVFRATC